MTRRVVGVSAGFSTRPPPARHDARMAFFPSSSTRTTDLALALDVHARAAADAFAGGYVSAARHHVDRTLEHARSCLGRPGGAAIAGATIVDALPLLRRARGVFDAPRIEALAVVVLRATEAITKVVLLSTSSMPGLAAERLYEAQAFVDDLCAVCPGVDDATAGAVAAARADALFVRNDPDAAVARWFRARQRFAAAFGEDAAVVAKLDRKLARCDVVAFAPAPASTARAALAV